MFLSDSLAIDKGLQSSIDFGIQYLLPKVKVQVPSRLPLFVSLSRGASAHGILDLSVDSSITGNLRSVELPKANESMLRFKSILLTAATTGLTLHPITYYYPHQISTATATSSQLSSPSSAFILSTSFPEDECRVMNQEQVSSVIRDQVTATKHGRHAQAAPQLCSLPTQGSSSPLEVAVRRNAINVLEAMVSGLELGKWFLGPCSFTASAGQRGGNGNKVSRVNGSI